MDEAISTSGLDLAKFGHGFQRSVIYELIRLSSRFGETSAPEKKEFNPDFTLILFEEPEAFLHPSQQEIMSYHLRVLSYEPTQQVIITTHSNIFAGKAANDICQIIRFRRRQGITTTYQPQNSDLQALFSDGGALLTALQAFVADPNIPQANKSRASKLIANPPQAEIAEDEEKFRYQLWLDSERSSLFFADKVLLVEGPSERALFNYLLTDTWNDLHQNRICVIDVLGKFNFHRFMGLLKLYQIPYGVILDDDNNKEHHQAINDFVTVTARASGCPILAPPQLIPDCLETMLGLPSQNDRSDKKPIEIMKAVSNNQIGADKLQALRVVFEKALAINGGASG